MSTLGEGIIKGVSLIKRGPALGHFDKSGRQMMVDEKTLSQIFECANQLGTLKIRADHGSGVLATIGYVENMRVDGDKILGDMHIYESEESRSKILEIAMKNPDHLGLSLEFAGDDEVSGEHVLARCAKLVAVALVSDPAANTSLFSAKPIPRVPLQDTVEIVNLELDTTMDIKQFDALSTRIKALEDSLSLISQADKAAPAPKAVDPTAAPAAQNPDADVQLDMTPAKRDGTGKDVDLSADADKSDKSDKDDEKLKKVAEFAAQMAIKAFSATLGTVKLAPAGVSVVEAPKAKAFAELVSEKTVELKGDKNAAMIFCLKNFSTEYKASRLVAIKP